MKVRLGMEQKESGGYLLEITRDSKQPGTGPHESQLTRGQCFMNELFLSPLSTSPLFCLNF